MVDNFGRLFALSELVTYCILPEAYSPPPEVSDLVRLTPVGQQIVERLVAEVTGGDAAAATLAVLGRWAGSRGMYVDTEQTDPASLRECLSAEVRARRIQYAWSFGRALHDEYVETYGRVPLELSHSQSASLLERVPQGVVQFSTFVTGPFGLLESAEARRMSLGGLGVFLRCIDEACTAIHVVRLATAENTMAARAFNSAVSEGRVPDDVRRVSQRSLLSPGAFYEPGGSNDLPWLLGNGLTPSESRKLLAALLGNRDVGLRPVLNSVVVGAGRRSPDAVVAKLDDAETIQLLLTLETRDIVTAIEILVKCGEIDLGPSEVRSALIRPGSPYGAFSPIGELSRLGVRFSGSLEPTARLGRV